MIASTWPLLPGSGFADGELELGEVRSVFGVRGELRLHLHHRDSTLLNQARPVVWIAPDGSRRRAALSTRHGAGQRVLGRVQGVGTPEDAATLIGWRFGVSMAELPAPAADEIYVAELIGMTVAVGDEDCGVVRAVHSTPGGDVVEVGVGLDVEFVLWRRAHLSSIDRAARRVVLTHKVWEES